MAWVADNVRFGQDGVSSVTWSEACDTSKTGWDKAIKLIVAAWCHSSDHAPGSKSLKLRWRNQTDNPTGSFADFVTGSGELRAGVSAGALVNTTTVTTGSACQTSAYSEEMENETPLQSQSFSPAKNEYIETQWCIDVSNALNSKVYEFEIYDVTGSASLGIFSYTVTTVAGADACTANNILSGTPVLGTPTAAVIHNFTANNIAAGNPVLGTPDIGQEHALTASVIASQNPVLGAPAIGQEHVLTANNIAAQNPVLGTPTAAEEGADACTADNILAGTPVLGTPVVGQEHALTADNTASQNPVLGTPAVGQEHALSADNIVSQSPVLGTPTAAVIHNLLAENVATGAPVISLPDIGQEHVLTATSFDTGNPALGTPTATAVNVLTADDILTGSPVLGVPTAAEVITHNLVALGITAGGGGVTGWARIKVSGMGIGM